MESPSKRVAKSPAEKLVTSLWNLRKDLFQYVLIPKLDVATFLNLAQSFKRAGELARMDQVWQYFYERDFPNEWAFCDDGVLPPFLDAPPAPRPFAWKRFYLVTRQYYASLLLDGGTFKDAKQFVGESFAAKRHIAYMSRIILRQLLDDHYREQQYTTIPPDDPELYETLSRTERMYWLASYENAESDYLDRSLGLNVLSIQLTTMPVETYLKILDSCFLLEHMESLPEFLHEIYAAFCMHAAHPNIFTYYMCFQYPSSFGIMTFCMTNGRSNMVREMLQKENLDDDERNRLSYLIDPLGTVVPEEKVFELFDNMRVIFGDPDRNEKGQIKFIQRPLSANAASMMRADSSI